MTLLSRTSAASTGPTPPPCAGRRGTAVVAILAFASAALPGHVTAAPIRLAEGGRALLEIRTAPGAAEQTRRAASDLGTMLGRMSGGDFRPGPAPSGQAAIIVGTATEFPGVLAPAQDPTRREDYVLRSERDRLLLVGQTPAAVEHAVWDLLHRLGYRQFFPGPVWEVIPASPSLRIDVDLVSSPAYHARRIWFGGGVSPERAADYEAWCRRNRATSGITLNSGHSYLAIMARHRAEFARHPEYLALVEGKRQEPKFCIANTGLRRLVVSDALAQFARQPSLDSISCDPSDGGGWCECAACAALGSVSDRALLLANEVAAAVNAAQPGRLVGMYAYSAHSPPPSIPAHPGVVISVATSFIRGGYTVDDLLAGWGAKAAMLGVREYYSVHPWDRDLPGAARGSNLGYLRSTLPHFHAQGARFMSAESSDNFGPNGLGYYVATRIMWDLREAENLDAIRADFLDRAFGPAREPMGRFYALLDGTRRQPLCDDLIGRMYRLLEEARRLSGDAIPIRRRIDELALYVRYAELFLDYSSASGPGRQEAFERLLRYGWRIRRTGVIHLWGLWQDLPKRDKAVSVPKVAAGADHPWKSEQPVAEPEVSRIIQEGIARRPLLDFTPVAFTGRLVPATTLSLPDVPRGNAGTYSRGQRDYWTWVGQAPGRLAFKGRAGQVYTNLGAAKVELFPSAEPELKSVARFQVIPDKAEHGFTLETRFTGLHRVEVNDGNQGTAVSWEPGLPMTVISSQDQPAKFFGAWHLYFYVPAGTRVIGGFSEGEGVLLDPGLEVAHRFAAKPGYFNVPVPPGQDGRLWSFRTTSGYRTLMTVPPCLARDARELLLPAEVIEADRRR